MHQKEPAFSIRQNRYSAYLAKLLGKKAKHPGGLQPSGVFLYIVYSLAMETSVDFTKAITSLPT
ncbi:hypothetical protein, partial [Pseudomonas tremae]|uniref:hypothetical protein n=1 Tax=Pseudomonas tremae TaxID=200454 RepID=UPI001F411350